mmetsp:Transcript_17310/g.46954  ORF Transcript_17310/g.46954 Transcript_17310/m.46954 type:complete len:243 (-) Transcript_17310:402-1130(-)
MFVLHHECLALRKIVFLWLHRFLALLCVRQPAHEISTALVDVGVGGIQSEIFMFLLTVFVCGILTFVICLRLTFTFSTRQKSVDCDLISINSFRLILGEHPPYKIFANRADPLHGFQLLLLDVVVVPEGEASLDHAVRCDAQGPNINLLAIAPVVHLGSPEDSRADLIAKPLISRNGTSCAKIAEGDVALLVGNIFPVHQVVVALDITMNDASFVEILHGICHLFRYVDNVVAVEFTFLLHV